MKRAVHILAGSLLTAALIPAGLGVSAGAASASACYGYSCHGLEPSGRCVSTADGMTLAKINNPLNPEAVAVLHNDYSAGCNSNWARAALTLQGYNDGDSLVLVITTTDSHGNLESMCYPGPNSTGALNEYCYESTYRATAIANTDMVDGTNVTRAYVYVYDLYGNLAASAEKDM